MPVRAQLGGATVRQHRLDRALRRREGFVRRVHQPIFTQLQVDHVTFFQVDNLVGHAGQGHGVAGQKMFSATLPHAQDQR